MMTPDWIAIFVSALVPLIFGGLWYSKPVYEALSGESTASRKHNPIVYALCFILAIPLSLTLMGFFNSHEATDQHALHGVWHGAMLGLFVVLPVMLVHFVFEGDRTVRNMLYHIAYWIISLSLIGLFLFAWL